MVITESLEMRKVLVDSSRRKLYQKSYGKWEITTLRKCGEKNKKEMLTVLQ